MEPDASIFLLVVVAYVNVCSALNADNATGKSRDPKGSPWPLVRVRRYSHLLGVNLNKPGNSSGGQRLVCVANQCLNGATCVPDESSAGGFKCRCVRGFYGLLCNNADPDCQSSPCNNNAICVVTEKGYRCDCSGKFFGDRCQYIRTTRNWMDDPYSRTTLAVCIAVVVVMLCCGIFCCVVNGERQALIDKYKWYIKLNVRSPEPTSFCYALHVVVGRYSGFTAFCSNPLNRIGRFLYHYICRTHPDSLARHAPPPQRPNTPSTIV